MVPAQEEHICDFPGCRNTGLSTACEFPNGWVRFHAHSGKDRLIVDICERHHDRELSEILRIIRGGE